MRRDNRSALFVIVQFRLINNEIHAVHECFYNLHYGSRMEVTILLIWGTVDWS